MAEGDDSEVVVRRVLPFDTYSSFVARSWLNSAMHELLAITPESDRDAVSAALGIWVRKFETKRRAM
jgi:hypothetical protein